MSSNSLSLDIRCAIKPSPTLYCGKYKGKTFFAVMHCDPQYCNWVMEIDNAKGDMLKLQKWLIEQCQASNSQAVPDDDHF